MCPPSQMVSSPAWSTLFSFHGNIPLSSPTPALASLHRLSLPGFHLLSLHWMVITRLLHAGVHVVWGFLAVESCIPGLPSPAHGSLGTT